MTWKEDEAFMNRTKGSKGMTKSAATIKVDSAIRCQSVSPKSCNTVGIIASIPQARRLARNILIETESDEIQGDIVITAYVSKRRITVLGYKNYKRQKNRT